MSEINKIKLIALSICFATRRSGEEFGRSYADKMAPDNVENAVIVEDTSSGFRKIKDLEKKSWEKYRTLAKHMTADGVDEEFQNLFGKVMASWIMSKM